MLDAYLRIILLESHLLSYQLIVFGFRNNVTELLEVALDIVYIELIYITNWGTKRSILRLYQVNSIGGENY